VATEPTKPGLSCPITVMTNESCMDWSYAWPP